MLLLYCTEASQVCKGLVETVVALAANIEWRRRYLAEHNLPPEHPRARTTDDVECFF